MVNHHLDFYGPIGGSYGARKYFGNRGPSRDVTVNNFFVQGNPGNVPCRGGGGPDWLTVLFAGVTIFSAFKQASSPPVAPAAPQSRGGAVHSLDHDHSSSMLKDVNTYLQTKYGIGPFNTLKAAIEAMNHLRDELASGIDDDWKKIAGAKDRAELYNLLKTHVDGIDSTTNPDDKSADEAYLIKYQSAIAIAAINLGGIDKDGEYLQVNAAALCNGDTSDDADALEKIKAIIEGLKPASES